MNKICLYLIFGLGFQSTLLAAPALPPPHTSQDFCEEIHQARTRLKKQKKGKVFSDVLKLTFSPGHLVQTKEVIIPVSPPSRIRSENDRNLSQNIIFSITPPADLTNNIDVEKMQARYRELHHEIKKLRGHLMKVAFQPSVEKCVEKSKSLGFSFEHFTTLATEANSLQLITQINESKKADRMIKRALRHLKLKWKVVHSTDMMEVHEMLRSHHLQNVVIISHGLFDGKLLDSRMNQYPTGFFSNISESVQSISLFSCHAEEIVKGYHLKERLESTPSNYSKHLLYFSTGTEIGGLKEVVPVSAFPLFLRRVESSLLRNTETEDTLAGASPTRPAPVCKIEISGLDVTSGALAFNLNGFFIGAAHAGETPHAFEYPCAFQESPKNILTLHGINLLGATTIQSTDFQILASKNGKMSHYYKDDHSYQGSKFEF